MISPTGESESDVRAGFPQPCETLAMRPTFILPYPAYWGNWHSWIVWRNLASKVSWFPRQEYWSELPFPAPNPGIEAMSPELARRFFTTEPPGKALETPRTRGKGWELTASVWSPTTSILTTGSRALANRMPHLTLAPHLQPEPTLSSRRRTWVPDNLAHTMSAAGWNLLNQRRCATLNTSRHYVGGNK